MGERKRSFFEWGQRLFGNQASARYAKCVHPTLSLGWAKINFVFPLQPRSQKQRATRSVPVLIKVINCVLTFEMV
jgi:hypothetical protein